MPISETNIRSVSDLLNEVKALDETNLRWLYRGQADAAWNLIPSVHRGYSQQQERYFTNEFRVRARSRYGVCPENNDYSGWLAIMQHYGLPTRLLDWTYSPLVAAFFAVHPDYAPPESALVRAAERDLTHALTHASCIWALAAHDLNLSQGFEPLIFPLDADSYKPLIEPAFKNRDEPNAIGVAMAIEHDPRIQLQQGAFTIHSNRMPLNRLSGAETWLRKLVIECGDVSDFLHELDILGIRKANLFPDLTSLASELKSYHRPGTGE